MKVTKSFIEYFRNNSQFLYVILATQCFFLVFMANIVYGAIIFPADSYYAQVGGRATLRLYGTVAIEDRMNALQDPHFATWSGEVSGVYSPYDPVNEPYDAFFEASASLPSGSIKLKARASDGGNLTSAEAAGHGLIQETLYLDWNSSVIDPIRVNVHWVASGFASASTYLAAETEVSIAMGGPDKISEGIRVTRDLTGGFASINETVIFNPSGDDHFLTVRAYLTATVIDGEADFSHTGTFSIDFPEGVIATSASGVFLTEAVPIPGALWLLGSGLIGLFGINRKLQK